MNRFAIVIAFDGPLEAAQSIQRQVETYLLGGAPYPGVQHITLHQNMLAEGEPPHQPWGAVTVVPAEREHDAMCASQCTDSAGDGCDERHSCWCPEGALSYAEYQKVHP